MKTCAYCGKPKDRDWHLVCAGCWQRLPQSLRDELYDAWQTARGSKRHLEAIRRCLRMLKETRDD